ncbi:response regulator transcription factor [Inconstantimicrobium mannanitabidum]|uniref:DNA-binding response regulator n=1 Tax=Inconstantimicrobium mannanitabidum TaxID=1604901 RepID=A0ACB5RGT2_9CLOT|nr:response regulator transcription factor [Clostridium sp. TW13]GKX68310.1 DNA-binding response regulator [Clostridium sp. TW13]
MNKDINILIVEDDNSINNMLARLLEKNDYKVTQAFSGTEAKLYLDSKEFQLVLMDLMLPGMNGEELLQYIRNTKTLPIIIISAKIDKSLKVELLRLGADDYITKPFDIEDVLARVYANLRRYIDFSNSAKDENSINQELSFKDIRLNLESKEVYVNNQKIVLTAREFNILKLFLQHPQKVFSKANIFESVWEEDYLGDDNTVNVHMSNLRNKLLKANPQEDYIETIWGMGYKLKS